MSADRKRPAGPTPNTDPDPVPHSAGPAGVEACPYAGESPEIARILSGSALSACNFQVAIASHQAEAGVSAEAVVVMGRLRLDTGDECSITVETPPVLYREMEMLSLHADIAALRSSARVDETGCVNETNLWTVDGVYSPEDGHLYVIDATLLERLAPRIEGDLVVALYDFADLGSAIALRE